MRKFTKYALLFAAALLTTAGLSSCSDDNNDNGETAGLTNAQKEMKAIGEQYVANTVNSTYKPRQRLNKVPRRSAHAERHRPDL